METADPVELVVGADGMIGGELIRSLAEAGRSALGTTRRPDVSDFLHLDLEHPPASWDGPPVSVAYLCAAIANLEACERDHVVSARTNVDGTLKLAEILKRQGAFVVFFSTNQVFDGDRPCRKPEEPTCPRNEYGRQKSLVEQRLLAEGDSAVLRLTKVIGPAFALFDRWVASARYGEPIRPFVDLCIAPVKLIRVLEVALEIGSRRSPGIYQLSGDEDLSYFNAAKIGFATLGLNASLILPGSRQDNLASHVSLPRFSSLDVTHTRTLLNKRLETSSETIRDYFLIKQATISRTYQANGGS